MATSARNRRPGGRDAELLRRHSLPLACVGNHAQPRSCAGNTVGRHQPVRRCALMEVLYGRPGQCAFAPARSILASRLFRPICAKRKALLVDGRIHSREPGEGRAVPQSGGLEVEQRSWEGGHPALREGWKPSFPGGALVPGVEGWKPSFPGGALVPGVEGWKPSFPGGATITR